MPRPSFQLIKSKLQHAAGSVYYLRQHARTSSRPSHSYQSTRLLWAETESERQLEKRHC